MRGEIFLSGDKSIAHRALILSALSLGKTKIFNLPASEDCLATIEVLRSLGVRIKVEQDREASLKLIVQGVGLRGLEKPLSPIFVSESGTTFRLMLGVLAGQDFITKLVAGAALSRRPMLRVTAPLRQMGAVIQSGVVSRELDVGAQRAVPVIWSGELEAKEEYPPIEISGGSLKGISYRMPVASAQVKSAILLAGLYAAGITKIFESVVSRDHTERMLKSFKADIKFSSKGIILKGGKDLVTPGKIYVPADISSAAFFLVAGSIIPDSEILIKNVSLNLTRCGIIEVLKRMGADIKVRSKELGGGSQEPAGDLVVRSAKLKGTVVKKREIPSLIDELPILMVAASVASGRTVFEDVGELRVKETDRIESMVYNLKKMGADVKVQSSKSKAREDVVVCGVSKLRGAKLKSFGDHRTAMSAIVSGLAAEGNSEIDDIFCVKKSFPNFVDVIKSILK